jgi:Spy/CpxP family protein refolding chaperone
MKRSMAGGATLVALMVAVLSLIAYAQNGATERPQSPYDQMMGQGYGMGMMGQGYGMGMMGPGMMGRGYGMGMMGQGYGTMWMQRLWALDLTPQQQEQIRGIDEQTAKTAIALEAKLDVQQIDLQQMLFEKNPDAGAIKAKIAEMGKSREDLQSLWVGAMMKSRDLLTQQQLDRYLAMAWNPHQGWGQNRRMESSPSSGSAPSGSSTGMMPRRGMMHGN